MRNKAMNKSIYIVFPIEKGVIDINYEDEQVRFSYPMLEPVSITLSKKFLEKGIIILNFIIMIEMGKKYKKIAKGDLKLLTKYFLEGWKSILVIELPWAFIFCINFGVLMSYNLIVWSFPPVAK